MKQPRPSYRFDCGQLLASAALRELTEVPDRWVTWRYVWRDKRWTKPPCRISGRFADSTDPSTWASFPDCARAAEANGKLDGVGFVLNDDGVVALDFDDCLDADGAILDRQISDLVARLGSYTEISPSGVGLRVLVRGQLPELPDGKRGFKVLVGATAVEVYGADRYVTLTGARFGDCPDAIEDGQPVLDWLVELHVRQQGRPSDRDGKPGDQQGKPDDADLRSHLDALLARDKKAAALWAGTAAPSGADKSRSAVMLALAGMLARKLRWTRTQLTWALETWCDEHGHHDKAGREIERTVEKVLGDLSREQPAAASEVDLDQLIERIVDDPSAAFEGETVDFLAALKSRDQAAFERTRARLKKAGVRVGKLDEVVAQRAPESGRATGQGRPIELREVESWDHVVDGAELLAGLVEHLHRFVILGDHAAVATALWVLHAHAHHAAFVSPRLALTSPVMRCGKSSLLRWLARVVPRSLPASNISAAALFRVIEAAYPTLLIDELDQVDPEKKVELVGIINSSHCRLDAQVIRVAGDQLEPRAFSTWAPMALAAIGKLPPQWVDRSIVIEMARKRSEDRTEAMRLDQDQGFGPLARKAARWARDNVEQLRRADPKMPPGLNDRQADNWRMLLALADLCGGEWPHTARTAATGLSLGDDDADARGIQALADIRQIFADRSDPEDITSDQLVNSLVEMEGRPWAEYRRDGKPITKHALARLLKPFGIWPGNLWRGGQVAKGYKRDSFLSAWERYLQTASPLDPTDSASFGDFQTAMADSGLAVSNPRKATATADPSDLAVCNPPRGPHRAERVANGATECAWCHDPVEPGALGITATSSGEYLHNRCVDPWSKA